MKTYKLSQENSLTNPEARLVSNQLDLIDGLNDPWLDCNLINGSLRRKLKRPFFTHLN